MSNELNRQRAQKANPLGGVSLDALMDRMTGADEKSGSVVVSKTVGIFTLRPDLQQPRRILPLSVRGTWNGDPQEVPRLLGTWLSVVNFRLKTEIPIKEALLGNWENKLSDEQKIDPAVWWFFDIVGLAVTIVKSGQREAVEFAEGVLIDGERRWWATHMLNAWVGKWNDRDFSKILGAEKAKPDVWAQAARNGARMALNAVGMARQLALLIMDMYEGDSGVKFDSFKMMVLPGEIDRKFYAQVANGEIYRIKRGMGEQVMSATGLKSMDMLRKYRAVLSIPDGLWLKADEQNWSLAQVLEYLEVAKSSSSNVTPLHTVNEFTVSGTVEGNDIRQSASPPTPLPRERGVSGLYVDKPANLTPDPSPLFGEGRRTASPPTPLPRERGEKQDVSIQPVYDDDFDDFEEEGPRESTVAVMRTWGEGRSISAVLGLLKTLAKSTPGTEGDKLRQLLIEMATISPSTISDWQQKTGRTFWRDYLDDASNRLGTLIDDAIIGELRAYLEHLLALGDEIRERRR